MEQPQPRLWSHLPDLCLLLIFSKLSMSDMIRRIGRVSTNWDRLQMDELRRRSTLTIIGVDVKGKEECLLEELKNDHKNPYGSNMIEHVRRDDGSSWVRVPTLEHIRFNALPSGVLTEGFTLPLMDKLPNITHLTVKLSHRSISPISDLELMTRLIDHYASSLVWLKLELDDYFLWIENELELVNELKTKVLSLFDSINRLESLRHLTLSVTIPNPIESRLSILSRLSTFTTNQFRPTRSLFTAMGQYATGNDDLRVECWDVVSLEEAIRLDPQLASKFIRFRVGDLNNSDFQYEDMQLFCQRFSSLHTLSLVIESMPMIVLAQCLSQLHQLVHLRLVFRLIPKERVNWEDSDSDDWDSDDSDNEAEQMEPPHEIAQVPSVRLLTLNLVTHSHLDTERLRLAQIFPHLQVLHLNHEIVGCFPCGYTYQHISEEEPKAYRQELFFNCVRLTREPFRQCAKLHTIKLDSCAGGPALFRSLLCQGVITRDNL